MKFFIDYYYINILADSILFIDVNPIASMILLYRTSCKR